MNDLGFIFFAVTVIALGVILLILLTKNSQNLGLNKQAYQVDWLNIMNSFDVKNRATYEMAILNADKLVARALKDLKISGETMGEQMKNAKAKFSNNDGLWIAHKLRNKIAHETNINLNPRLVQQALAQFKRALKDLGAF